MTLASASPQRRAILAQVGIEFEVRPADVEELEAGDPVEVARENARRKATAVAGELVLGADTVVALGGDVLGKPRDAVEARRFLERLNGRTHQVIGGLAIVDGHRTVVAHEITNVTFRRVDAATLDWYVSTGEWQGRAGGYAIQGAGAALVARIEGDYLNVVGLPLARLLDLQPGLR